MNLPCLMIILWHKLGLYVCRIGNFLILTCPARQWLFEAQNLSGVLRVLGWSSFGLLVRDLLVTHYCIALATWFA